MKLILTSENLQNIVKEIRPYLKNKTLLLLEGEMGAGKTTLVGELMASFGYALASSPTYALRQTYETSLMKVEHIDLYRLKDEEDVESIGLWDVFQNAEALVIIEWPSKVPMDQWPMDWKKYCLKITKNNSGRKYEFYIDE